MAAICLPSRLAGLSVRTAVNPGLSREGVLKGPPQRHYAQGLHSEGRHPDAPLFRAVDVLRAHRRRQAELRLQLGAAWVDTGLVFTKADGAALVPDSVSQRFERLVIRADLPPVRLHDLRHLAASLTYRATKDLKLTSQMLGHASTAITVQVHTSVVEDVEREAAESAAALVPRAHRAPTDADAPT